MVPTKRSAIAFARGARTGVLMIVTSVAVNTASKAAVNLLSRSRTRNRKCRWASSRSITGRDRNARWSGDALGLVLAAPYRRRGKPWHRPQLQNLHDYDIVRIYGAEYRSRFTEWNWAGRRS